MDFLRKRWHDVSLVLFDTGMRPEEWWENSNSDNGRNGMLLITKGNTK